jgi:hypothetical protein
MTSSKVSSFSRVSQLLCVALSIAAARPVAACEWGSRALPHAREALARGWWEEAYVMAQAYQRDRDLAELLPIGADAVLLEMQHAAAVAAARAEGGLGPLGAGMDVEGDRQANLHWAVLVLRYQLVLVDNHPRRQVELAYALAPLRYHADLARAMLVDLAARDLMPNADGWVLLARLERRVGDTRAERAALASCVALGPPQRCTIDSAG